LKDYFSGEYASSPAKGALFGVNPKTQDARISGSLASLCGLEKALSENNNEQIEFSIRKIIMMQAHSFLLGGIPMIFYGDEMGYTNDYSYLYDSGKSYDNRWMHRPVIDWNKNEKRKEQGSIEERIFSSTKKLISIRKSFSVIADKKNITWLTPHNIHVAGYMRAWNSERVYCLFNFSSKAAYVTWYIFKEHGMRPKTLFDHWRNEIIAVGPDHEYLIIEPYEFYILEVK